MSFTYPCLYLFLPLGGAGGLSDTRLKYGAAAAAAAGGAARGPGERHGTRPARQAYQRPAHPHGCPPSVCVHCR